MKVLKLTINLIFLTISISLSAYFMINLTNNNFIKIGLVIFVINLEAAMQYILALGKQKFITKRRVQALLLFVCYAMYVIIYNIPSGVGFFLAEMDIQDTIYYKAEFLDNVNQQRLKQIDTTINNLNLQLQTESKTGYGSRSKAIVEQIDKLLKEQSELSKTISEVPKVIITKNPFQSLSNALKVRTHLLAAIIFGVSMLMLCVVLIITSWDLPRSNEVIAVKKVDLHGKTTDKQDLITYVNAAIRDTGKLNGNQRIMDETGLSLDQCIKFRNWLTKLKIDGTPAISVRQGGGNVNIPKHKILKAIEGV